MNYTYRLLRVFYESLKSMVAHDGIEHAGYLAFLLMCCIFPFLVCFTSIIGIISDILEISIADALTDLVLHSEWASFVESLRPRIEEIVRVPPQSFLTIAILGAVWSASSIFEAIRTTLNRAYNITTPPAYIWRRLLSIVEFFTITLMVAVVLITAIVVPNLLSVMKKYVNIEEYYLLSVIGDANVRGIAIYVFGFTLLSYIYCFLPSKRQSFKTALPGTIGVLLLWSCFSRIFHYYISYFPQINLIYGSVAGVIISLLYFYICSLILIFGAEFSYCISQHFKR